MARDREPDASPDSAAGVDSTESTVAPATSVTSLTRRLDVALVDRGLARSRTVARAAIEAGRVTVSGRAIVKPAHPVADSDAVELDGDDRYVSRAALKLVADRKSVV